MTTSAEYDPVKSLQHWPTTPMGKYGKNPYGENLYRIVLADSRRHLVGGCYSGEGNAYHYRPKYRNCNGWVLERWRSALEATQMTRLQWDTQMVDPASGWLLLGPYPARGEYEKVWEFDHGVDSDNLDKIIATVEHNRNDLSFEDVRRMHKAEYAAEEKAHRTAAYEEIRDCMTAWGGSPLAGAHVRRGTKTTPELRTAEELGLPLPKGSNTFISGRI